MNKELLNTPGCDRIKDFYNVGPIQRANVECFFDAIIEHLANGVKLAPFATWHETDDDCGAWARPSRPVYELEQVQLAAAAARIEALNEAMRIVYKSSSRFEAEARISVLIGGTHG